MAETLKFKLYPQAAYETPRSVIRWYQSLDGLTWDTTPVDTAVILSLPASGVEYTWDSVLALADRFHMLKVVDINGVEADNGLTIPPMSQMIHTEMTGVNLSAREQYSPGDTVEFLFRLNDKAITKIGDSIRVDLVDEGQSLVDTIYARRIGSLYSASWDIPLNINEQLTAVNHFGSNAEFFTIYDKWNLIGGATTFQFDVNRHIEDPSEDNCILHISLNGINDSSNISAKDSVVLFTTKLSPFYCTVHDVRSVAPRYIEEFDDFTILKKIINMSRIVDDHMKPSEIFYENAYNLAVKNYVKTATALEMIIPVSQTNQEEKRIDTFSYSVNSATPKAIIDPLQDMARRYALFIWAGGKDTPFVARIFAKGLFDPARPNLARAEFDEGGWFPYLNAKTSSYTTVVDGDNIEIRGERMVAHRYLLNRYSNFSADNGDVGYLARI
jgi:hypothetical protein